MMSADTKIGLHLDPGGFLASVASTWSPTEDLGHVQGGQYSGYLFPMGPFFALGRAAGLAPWLVHRLWLGALLALAAWGTLRLLDALLERPRGVAHLVAGLVVLLNPYVVVFTARTTVTLLGYAALPWLLLAVHRGLRAPRSWWWPAAFAVVVACSGGGVNAAVTAWLLLGPLLLALYERLVGGVGWRALLAFGWRTAALTALASLWWVIPVLVQTRHGVDFLRFTEQPGSIWSTTSLSESLRLMGYWLSYLGVGFGGSLRPLFSGRRGDAVLVARGDRRAAGPGAGSDRVHLDAAVAVRAVLPPAGARGSARDDGRLPGGDAAAPGDELHLQPRRGGAVPADVLQGRPADGARDRLSGGRRSGAVARSRALGAGGRAARARPGGVAAGHRPGARLAAAARARAARLERGGRPRGPPRRPATGEPSCSPASCMATTTGAGRSTRSCRRWPSARWRCATRSRTRTCGRSTCCGRSTGWCSSGGRCPASSARCSTCWAPARWSRAPTTTAAAAAPCRPARRPTCSTSSGRPIARGGRCARSGARPGRSAAGGGSRACAPGIGRPRGRRSASSPPPAPP